MLLLTLLMRRANKKTAQLSLTDGFRFGVALLCLRFVVVPKVRTLPPALIRPCNVDLRKRPKANLCALIMCLLP